MQNAEPGAVTFGAYMQRATTRAGLADVMNLDNLKKSQAEGGGFGVFGYYTNSATYDQQAVPNFFYNEKVTWNGEFFEYNPIKYWPNEFGTSAESEDQDKVSFFAYAPYVEVSPSTGKVIKWDASEPDKIDQEASAKLQKWGITTLSNNSATGDPLVKYIVSFDQDKSVDLCWGVCDDINWPIVMNGSSQQINNAEKGLPWLDVQRPADPTKLSATTGQKVKFTFKHATAQLKVNIDAFVDGTDNTNPIADKTKVFVRSITFEGFATKGALNLNNTESGANIAYWMDWTGSNDIVTGEAVTIYDGRKDGKEGTPSGIATNEKSLGLNPALIQTDKATIGVTKDLQPLFCKGEGAATAPIYVIPTGDDVKVTITYDIETEDDKLSTYISDATTHGSSIENVITKTINFGTDKTFKNGNSYVINLHLGMNSVKFDAAVTDWVETSDADVDLPKNVPVFDAVSGGKEHPVILPANVTKYTFAVSGLNGGEVVTVTPDNTVVESYTPTTVTANASGVALIEATIAENTKVNKNTSGNIVITGASAKATIKIEQAPAPLGLGVKEVKFDGNTIELKSVADVTWTSTDDIADATRDIKVLKNGVALTTESGSATPTDNKTVNWDAATQKLFFKDDFKVGDTYTITVKAGAAEAETVVAKICEIKFAKNTLGVTTTGDTQTGSVQLINTGDGKVTYNTASSNITVDSESGLVTGVSLGNATVNATVENTTTCFYKKASDYFNVGVGELVIGNNRNFSVPKGGATCGLKLCGLASEETVEITKDQDWVTINSSTTNIIGEHNVIFNVGANDTSKPREAKITVKCASGTTEITVIQAGS